MARNTRCTSGKCAGSPSRASRAESSSISRSRASARNAPRICSITSIGIVKCPFRTPFPLRASAHDLFHYRKKLVRVERLYNPGRRAGGLAFLFLVRIRLAGQQHDRNELICRHRSKLARELEAVHFWHIDVSQEEVEFLALQFGQCVDAVHRLDNLIAGAPQHYAYH